MNEKNNIARGDGVECDVSLTCELRVLAKKDYQHTRCTKKNKEKKKEKRRSVWYKFRAAILYSPSSNFLSVVRQPTTTKNDLELSDFFPRSFVS